MENEQRFIADSLKRYGLQITDLQVGIEDKSHVEPVITVSRESYPGVEPHLVTIADIAGWYPDVTPENDVILTLPFSANFKEESISPGIIRQSWERLLSATRRVMELLESYREQVAGGYFPSVLWIYHFMGWHHRTWCSRRLEPTPVDQWLDYVDPSIRPHIKKLNEFGLITRESCSGHPDDHVDTEPFWPYVMFEERAYPGVSAHLFTLADIASWIPIYGRHGFDVSLEVPRYVKPTRENIESLWNDLISSARRLMPLLEDYVSMSQTNIQNSISNPSLFRTPMRFLDKDPSEADKIGFRTGNPI